MYPLYKASILWSQYQMYAFFYIPLKYLFSVVLVTSVSKQIRNYLSPLIAVYVSILYLLGMYRSGGIDVNNYRRAYNNTEIVDIFDPGYQFMMSLSRSVGLPFEVFLLSIGIINLFLIRYICSKLSVNYGLVLAIFALHLFIVRDFTQLRVSLAINLVMSAYFMTKGYRYIVYILGISIHVSALALVGVLVGYTFYKRSGYILKILPFLGIILISLNIGSLSFLDPRIDLYINWAREGYGNPVASYKQLIFVFVLLFMALYENNFRMNIFVYSFLFSAVMFLSFSNISIFSFRLTNICMSFYPFFLAKLVRGETSVIAKLSFLLVVISALLLRQDSMRILESIVLGIE